MHALVLLFQEGLLVILNHIDTGYGFSYLAIAPPILNSEFSFLKTGYYTRIETFYLLLVGVGRKDGLSERH